MSIRFSCSCGRKLKVSDEKIGMKVLCSSCGTTLKVPKKSQDAYWQDVAAPSGEPTVDYAGIAKDFLIQIVPAATLLVVVVWLAYVLSSQILIGRGNLPSLGTVQGTITLDGKPVSNAMVRFVPLDEKEDRERKGGASVSLGFTDDAGHYSLIYVKETPGAAVGRHRVEIEAKDAAGRERVKTDFNLRSTLRTEVKAGSNELNFDVQGFGSPTASGGTPSR